MTFIASPAAVLLEGAGLGGLVLATITDLRSRIIPNALVLWVAASGAGARIATDGPLSWISLVAAVLVFAPLALLAYRDFIGGGDAKMIPAATLLVEPSQVLGLLTAIILSGGVLACVYWVAARGARALGPRPGDAKTGTAASGSAPSTGAPASPGRREIPYAVAILAGVALTLHRLT